MLSTLIKFNTNLCTRCQNLKYVASTDPVMSTASLEQSPRESPRWRWKRMPKRNQCNHNILSVVFVLLALSKDWVLFLSTHIMDSSINHNVAYQYLQNIWVYSYQGPPSSRLRQCQLQPSSPASAPRAEWPRQPKLGRGGGCSPRRVGVKQKYIHKMPAGHLYSIIYCLINCI